MATTEADTQDQIDMARLVAGHERALNDLMDRHATPVHRFLYRMLGNEDDASELAQETFVRVYQHRENFKPGYKFTTWLYTIAANLGRNQLRWRSHRQHVSLDAELTESEQSLSEILPANDPTPTDVMETTERATAVRSAVARLPEDLREAIVLCELEDRPVIEAAEILQTTPKAVESRLYRARKLLRERLQRWLE